MKTNRFISVNIVSQPNENRNKLDKLTQRWAAIVVKTCASHLDKVNGRYVCIGDGIKIAKEGKKMPAVKKLHQESQSNTKAQYIMGHSCQAIGLLAGQGASFFTFSHS